MSSLLTAVFLLRITSNGPLYSITILLLFTGYTEHQLPSTSVQIHSHFIFTLISSDLSCFTLKREMEILTKLTQYSVTICRIKLRVSFQTYLFT